MTDDDKIRRRLLDHRAVEGKPAGRNIKHDERSWAYRWWREVERTPKGQVREGYDRKSLERVEHDRVGGVFYQGRHTMSCTGNAMAGLLNTYPFHLSTRKPLEERHAIALYAHATEIDDLVGTYPYEDTGSYGLDVCKVAKDLGYISGYRHAFSVDEALDALQELPVLTGVYWYESFDEPDSNHTIHIRGPKPAAGHAFVVRGYDPDTGLVKADNSWADSWGDNGSFYFTVETWETLLAQEGDVTVPIPNGHANA